jgi:hypothetical protein
MEVHRNFIFSYNMLCIVSADISTAWLRKV